MRPTELPKMPCGHPLASRQIVSTGANTADLKTICWTCAVETEIRNQPPKPIQVPTGRAHW
jgi:hypothetical protein